MAHETSISLLLNLHSNADLVFVLWDAEWHRLGVVYWFLGTTLVPYPMLRQSKNKKMGPIYLWSVGNQ